MAMERDDRALENLGEIVIFNGEDGQVRVQVDAVNETIWLNQKGLAELFGVTTQSITIHLRNIFNDGELTANSVCKEFLHTASDGKNYKVKFYNLDAIIAVGYRVNSKRATAFRIWASSVLKSYMIKGFALDDERMKRNENISHFRELIDRIREIRLSERVFYQQIKDIYKLSEDYDPKDEKTVAFFQEVQNKLLWAVSKQTAAELIYYRANASLPQMGLTSTEIKGIVKSSDISIGKNYLSQEEIGALKLIVEQYLAFAESQANAHHKMYQKDWMEALDLILKMNRRELLEGKGRISRALAEKKAKAVYDEYRTEQKRIEKMESLRELEADLKKLGSESSTM